MHHPKAAMFWSIFTGTRFCFPLMRLLPVNLIKHTSTYGKCVDGPTWPLQFADELVWSHHSLAFARTSLGISSCDMKLGGGGVKNFSQLWWTTCIEISIMKGLCRVVACMCWHIKTRLGGICHLCDCLTFCFSQKYPCQYSSMFCNENKRHHSSCRLSEVLHSASNFFFTLQPSRKWKAHPAPYQFYVRPSMKPC